MITDHDDRVLCRDCRHLHAGKCAQYRAVAAHRGYSPVRDVLRRCEAFDGRQQ